MLNDLTHFLKFGDVTVRRDSNEFEIIEVKAGTSGGGRVTRQRQGLNEIVSLLSKDQGREVQGTPVKISSVDIVPEMFIRNLQGLLERARIHGAAVEMVGSHLLIECIDFMAARERALEKERAFGILDRGRALMAKWKAADDFVFPCEAHQRYAHAQNYAPISICPLEPKACIRLMAGAVSLMTFVNVSAVLRELEDRGWKVGKSPFQLAQFRGSVRSARARDSDRGVAEGATDYVGSGPSPGPPGDGVAQATEPSPIARCHARAAKRGALSVRELCRGTSNVGMSSERKCLSRRNQKLTAYASLTAKTLAREEGSAWARTLLLGPLGWWLRFWGVGRDLPSDLSSRLLLLPQGFARRSDCTSVASAPRGSASGRCLSVADHVTMRGPTDRAPAAGGR